MKVVDFLKKASQWTRGVLAKCADGKTVSPRSKRAVKFCLRGALERCYQPGKRGGAEAKLRMVVPRADIVLFNDDPKTTFRDVRRVLKEADV